MLKSGLLLENIEDWLVNVVVVYKIGRLSRSLVDFAKLVDVFDWNGVTFVSEPKIVASTFRAARPNAGKIAEADAGAALHQLDLLCCGTNSSPSSRRASWRCWSSASISGPRD